MLLAAGCGKRGYAVPGIGSFRNHYIAPAFAPIACLGVVDISLHRTWGPDGEPVSVPLGYLRGRKHMPGEASPFRWLVFVIPGAPGRRPDLTLDVTGKPIDMVLPSGSASNMFDWQYDYPSKRWIAYVVCGAPIEFSKTDVQTDVTAELRSAYVTVRCVSDHGRLTVGGPGARLVEHVGLSARSPQSSELTIELQRAAEKRYVIVAAVDRYDRNLTLPATTVVSPPKGPVSVVLSGPRETVAVVTLRLCTAQDYVFRYVSLQPR